MSEKKDEKPKSYDIIRTGNGTYSMYEREASPECLIVFTGWIGKLFLYLLGIAYAPIGYLFTRGYAEEEKEWKRIFLFIYNKITLVVSLIYAVIIVLWAVMKISE